MKQNYSGHALHWLRAAPLGLAFGIGLGLAVSVASPAAAQSLVFDRGLPTTNINNAAGANRSNVAWADGNTTVSMGDNFTIGDYNTLTNLRVWVAAPALPNSNDYTLWLGADTGATTTVSSVATSSAVTQVTYAGGVGYQRLNGTMLNLYQVDFSLNLTYVTGGTVAFGISGPAIDSNGTPSLAASNAALSGSTQDGADGSIYGFTLAGVMDTGNGYPYASLNNGWDKSSDINVQVFANVPEPISITLLGSAVAGLLLVRRRANPRRA